jgi:putative peptidoglycan lipid II flippase
MTRLSSFLRSLHGDGVNRSILHAAAVVTVAGVAAKCVGTVKEIAVAGIYGRSDAMDAYLAAALIPGLLINLIAESMNQALIPTLVKVREREGREQAQQLLSCALLWLVLLLTAAALAMALGARGFFPLIASHYPAAKLDLAVRLFYALLPTVVLSGVAALCSAVLNTCERFAAPALAPALLPLAILSGALLLGGRMGVWALVWASVAGALLHTGLLAKLMDVHGYRFQLRRSASTQASREVVQQYGPVLLSSLVASGGLLVDQSMAAMLPAGSVSALAYAGRYVGLVLTLLGGAVSTALVPYLSRLVAQRDWAACRRTLRLWLGGTALLSVPLALLLIAAAPELVRLTLQHGVFHRGDTQAVAPVLAMYALQIPFFVTSRVFYRFLVALRRTDLIFYCGAVNLALDVVLNLLLMRSMGVAGIALATSLWTVSTFLFLGFWTGKLLARAEAAQRQGEGKENSPGQGRI